MTEAKNSMNFYRTYGMKETCTEARREDETWHIMYDLEIFQTECDKKITSISIFMLDISISLC